MSGFFPSAASVDNPLQESQIMWLPPERGNSTTYSWVAVPRSDLALSLRLPDAVTVGDSGKPHLRGL